MAEQLYEYRWGNDKDPVGRHRLQFKGRRCTVYARGTMNTVGIRFVDNNEPLSTSGNALRKVEK